MGREEWVLFNDHIQPFIKLDPFDPTSSEINSSFPIVIRDLKTWKDKEHTTF
jgi:hypothetical protein